MIKNKKQTKTSKAKGSIRIIAGKYRGRKLPVIMAEGLRPTTDRVKETVFNWLMPYIQEASCLDCFSGSGSLGFEALSRGASQVTLVELNKEAVKQLQQNKSLIKADNIAIINNDILSYLAQPPKPYDLVFIDPPFRKQLIEKTIQLLTQGWLKDQSLIYIEMEMEADFKLPNNWQLLKEKIAGQVSYRLYQTGYKKYQR